MRKEPPGCPELAVTALWETGTPGSRAMLPLDVDEATALVITDRQQAGLHPPTYAFAPLGHRSIGSTMKYVGTTDAQAAEAVQSALMGVF